MHEITLEGKKYLSSKKSAEFTGYSKDYVGQLCREGRVKARLVGRNWYVLESSIYEHRFGAAELSTKAKDASQEPVSAWEVANYSHEEVIEPLPTLILQEKIQEINILEGRNPILAEELAQQKPEFVPVSEKLVSEMHSAWEDWFSALPSEKKPSEEVYEEEETPVVLEKIQEPQEIDEIQETTSENDSEVEVKLNKVEEKEEETVPIHRSFSAPARYTPVYNAPTLPQQGRIIRERVVVTRRKAASPVLRSFFVVLGLLAVGITVIGSGYVSSYLEKYNLNVTPFQYLAGEYSIK
jgi:hypothetical protein